MTVADDNIKLVCSDPDPESFLQRIITGDETWISMFTPEPKQGSTSWVCPDELRPQKSRSTGSAKKTMMTLFLLQGGYYV